MNRISELNPSTTEIPITKDYWTPDAGELTLLTQEPDATTRGYLEKSMFAD
jgi:hypothetical protein